MMRYSIRALVLAISLFPCLAFGGKTDVPLEEVRRLIQNKHYQEALMKLEGETIHALSDEHECAVLVLQGQALLGLKEIEKASKKGAGALSLFQNDPEALVLMGQIEKAKGHREVAEQFFWRALKEHPKHPVARSEVIAMQMEDSMMDPTSEDAM